MFNAVIQQWIDDWKTNKFRFILELVGTLLSMTASILLALSMFNLFIIYLIWMSGSICLIVSSYMRQSYWVLVLMSFYTLVNIIGLYRFK